MRIYLCLLLSIFYGIAAHAADMSQQDGVTVARTTTTTNSYTFRCYSSCFSRCLARACRRWTTPVVSFAPTDASDNNQEDEESRTRIESARELRKRGSSSAAERKGVMSASPTVRGVSPVPPLRLDRIQLSPPSTLHNAVPGELA